MNWKKIGKRILFPHPAILVLIIIAAAILLVYGFACFETTHPVSIASYAFSFYALVLVVLRGPDIIACISKFKRENRYLSRFYSDVRFRMNLTLYSAFGFNAVYAAFQLALGLKHHSVWFYSMAAYYLLLALMRLLLVRYTRRHSPGEQQAIEWRKYRFCGVCLLAMTLALGVIITYFVLRIREFEHHEITTIAMAAYTFTSLALAVRNAIRYKRFGSPAYSAAKAISLVSATVSMLTLENAMFTAFGNDSSELLRQVMLGGTGVCVLLVVQGISLYMIINACKKLGRIS